MKVNIETNRLKKVPAREMGVGDLAIINNETTPAPQGHIVLRTYDRLVDLNQPRLTWEFPLFEVEVLPPGTKVTLEVE